MNRDWSISLVSQQQPWHPAWSRQWTLKKHYAKECWSRKSPQTAANEKHVTPLTPNVKTGGMWFTFPQLAGGANVTFLNPSLELSFAIERVSPSTWHGLKTKDGTTKVAEWKLLLRQHTEEGGLLFFFFRSEGGRQTFQMLSRQKGGRFSP